VGIAVQVYVLVMGGFDAHTIPCDVVGSSFIVTGMVIEALVLDITIATVVGIMHQDWY
jgi:hypothetical protein